MRISVLEHGSGKTVVLEVEPYHTAGSIVEAIVDGLSLPKSDKHELHFKGRTLMADSTLASNKVRDGDQLQLEEVCPLIEKVRTPRPKPAPSETRKGQVRELERKTEAKTKAEEFYKYMLGGTEEKESVSPKDVTGYVPKFCTHCGKPVRARSKFCLDCGTPT